VRRPSRHLHPDAARDERVRTAGGRDQYAQLPDRTPRLRFVPSRPSVTRPSAW
jgi:hypothetical protein